MAEAIEQLKEALFALGEALAKALKPIAEELSRWIETLEPYQRFELAHPKKKPRGSIRRHRRG